MVDTDDLGGILRERRLAIAWTQYDVAWAAGLAHPSYVSRLENGKWCPDSPILAEIGRALGLTTEEINELCAAAQRSVTRSKTIQPTVRQRKPPMLKLLSGSKHWRTY